MVTRFLTQDGVVHAVNGVSFNLKKGELLEQGNRSETNRFHSVLFSTGFSS